MKILIISQYFWPENFRLNDITIELVKKGHEVTVLTGIPNYPIGKFYPGYSWFKKRIQNYHGVNIIRVPVFSRGKGNIFQLVLGYISFTLSSSIRSLFFSSKEFDVILFSLSPLAEGIPAVIMKIFKHTPIIYWVQDIWPESLSSTNLIKSKFILSSVNLFIKLIYKRCSYIMIKSNGYITSIHNKGIAKEKIIFFPDTAESIYKPLDKKEPSSVVPDEGFCVMFAGNIGVAQDFDTILKTAEILHNNSQIHWVIIGDGRMASYVKNEIIRRNLSTSFHLLGRYPLENMPKFFSQADVLLVTLKNDPILNMAIPGKIQSYLACAKPIIAALNGEGATIINQAKAGITCDAENPQQLADAVLKMYDMSERARQALGANGRKYFELNFEQSMLLDRLVATMENALK